MPVAPVGARSSAVFLPEPPPLDDWPRGLRVPVAVGDGAAAVFQPHQPAGAGASVGSHRHSAGSVAVANAAVATPDQPADFGAASVWVVLVNSAGSVTVADGAAIVPHQPADVVQAGDAAGDVAGADAAVVQPSQSASPMPFASNVDNGQAQVADDARGADEAEQPYSLRPSPVVSLRRTPVDEQVADGVAVALEDGDEAGELQPPMGSQPLPPFQ